MLIYNHFMIVSYFKTTDKIIYFFTFLFNLFWVSMPLAVGVNLAVSFSCIVGCPICKIYLVDHGYRKFKEKIHFMEQYR